MSGEPWSEIIEEPERDPWPECKEFYDLMQVYRHWPMTDQKGTVAAYEAVKEWLRRSK